ncbi:MAG: DivIVA domain-containing protein [Gaiellaceae bacterium]
MARTPQEIRDAELPKARRGFDETATRELLAEAAAGLTAANRERDDLQRQVDELKKTVAESPTEAELIGRVLLTANHVAEDLVEKAREEAEKIRQSAETRQREVVELAQLHADAQLTELTARIESLRGEEALLQRSIAAHRNELVTFLRSALQQLDGLEPPRPQQVSTAGLEGDLLSQLPGD